MSQTHWCSEHQTARFKSGRMKGYSHPIKDSKGEPVLDGEGKAIWCNEPEETAGQSPKPSSKSGSTDSSIELQVAYKGIVELAGLGKLEMNSNVVLAALNWAMSKLGNWSSMGTAEKMEDEQPNEPKATEAQLKKIFATSEEKGYAKSLAVAIMLRLYKVGSSRELTKTQADDFIKKLTEGYGLDQAKEEGTF